MKELAIGDLVILDQSIRASNSCTPNEILMIVEKKRQQVGPGMVTEHPAYYVYSTRMGKMGPFQRGELYELVCQENSTAFFSSHGS